MKDLLVIIPVHKIDREVEPLLSRAINSVPENVDILISTNLNKADFVDVVNIERVEFVQTQESDFQSLVNYAVDNCGKQYKWFSILEYDDEYTSIWLPNFEKYLQFKPEVSVFIPMNDIVDFESNQYVGFGNEAPWASSFSSEIGYVDNECLQNYFDFYLTGAIFNIEDWKEVGGLKPSMKLTFWYELMLRWTNKDKKFYVIPKIGYKHYVNRPDSLYESYRNAMLETESAWWFETARQECFYKKDRNKTYNESTKGE